MSAVERRESRWIENMRGGERYREKEKLTRGKNKSTSLSLLPLAASCFIILNAGKNNKFALKML